MATNMNSHAAPPVVIFTALAWESAAVRAILQRVQRTEERAWRGFAGTTEVLIVTGGIGPRRTQRTVEQFTTVPFSAVLSVGCAGALIPGLSCGQLVLAPHIYMPDLTEIAQVRRYAVDPTLLAHARAAALTAGIPIAEGPLFTSPKVLFTPQEKAQRGQETGAIAVEMESGVHAAFAVERGLPFVALRVILDGVDMRLPAIKGLPTPEGEIRMLKAALHVATHPHHLPALLALKRAQMMASDTLRRICHSVLHSHMQTYPPRLLTK
jgi:adenosylhomocysteine nucleosidase